MKRAAVKPAGDVTCVVFLGNLCPCFLVCLYEGPVEAVCVNGCFDGIGRYDFGTRYNRKLEPKEIVMVWTTPTLVEICIGLEINGYLPAEF